ncbi:MAG: hypothetical protein ACFBSE_03110, partial [Prochloraceae cyanobacterium]
LIKGAKTAEKILKVPGADEVFSRLSPEQIQKLEQIKQLQKAGDRNKAWQLLQQISAEVGNDADLDRALLLLDRVSQIDRPSRTDVDGTEIVAKTDREQTSATSPSSEQVESDPNSTVKEPESTTVNNADSNQLNRDALTDAPSELTNALPPNLRGDVPISVDSSLDDNTVRVYYRAKNGLIGDIEIVAGSRASAVEIKLHVTTVRLMRTYSGLLGRIRRLSRQILAWFKAYGSTEDYTEFVGTRAFEAKLEIDKLERILASKFSELSSLSPSQISNNKGDLLEEIRNLELQLAKYEITLKQMDKNPGLGYIAAAGSKPDLKRIANQEFLEKISADTNFQERVNNIKSQQTANTKERVELSQVKSEIKNLDNYLGKANKISQVETVKQRLIDYLERKANALLENPPKNLTESEISQELDRLIKEQERLENIDFSNWDKQKKNEWLQETKTKWKQELSQESNNIDSRLSDLETNETELLDRDIARLRNDYFTELLNRSQLKPSQGGERLKRILKKRDFARDIFDNYGDLLPEKSYQNYLERVQTLEQQLETILTNAADPNLVSSGTSFRKNLESQLAKLEDGFYNLQNQIFNQTQSSSNTSLATLTRDINKLKQEVKTNPSKTTELKKLEAEREKFKQQKGEILAKTPPGKGKPEAKFNEDIQKPEDVFDILKNGGAGNQLTIDGDEYTGSAFTKYVEMLKAQGIVTNEQNLIDTITNNNIPFKGRKISEVAHDLKKAYRDEVTERMVINNPNPDDLEVFKTKYQDLSWSSSNNPADNKQALEELRYIKFNEIVTSLDPADKGSLAEIWYERVYSIKRGEPYTTQAVVEKDNIRKTYGIELEKDRRYDEIFGPLDNATIREQKTISGPLGEEGISQFRDYMKILTNKDKYGNPQVVEIESGGKIYQIRNLRYSFTLPEGVKANAVWMDEQLTNDLQGYISFEIFNSRGERKIITNQNISELDEANLTKWLGI